MICTRKEFEQKHAKQRNIYFVGMSAGVRYFRTQVEGDKNILPALSLPKGLCDLRELLFKNLHFGSGRSGFTLVEILMVLAIMGIMTVVAMPSLVKSIRGNRLRVGTRTIVMAANYARTSAILRNQEMKVTLDKENNQVSVEPLRSAAPSLPSDQIFKTDTPAPISEPALNPDTAPEPLASATPFANITRKLDAVQIESVSVEGSKSSAKGDATIIYQSNGRCTPFEVSVVDEFGSSMNVAVDAIGSIKVTQKGN